MNDSLLALSYVEAYDISYPEALNRIADEVAEIKQTLENTGRFELNDIGTIILNETRQFILSNLEAGILTPELWFRQFRHASTRTDFEYQSLWKHTTVVEMTARRIPSLPQQREVPTLRKRQTLSLPTTPYSSTKKGRRELKYRVIDIRKSWLRNIAAACIAIIAFFTLSTPLGTSNVQKSQIDTGMLTKVMPKELTQPAHELVLANNVQAAETLPSILAR